MGFLHGAALKTFLRSLRSQNEQVIDDAARVCLKSFTVLVVGKINPRHLSAVG